MSSSNDRARVQQVPRAARPPQHTQRKSGGGGGGGVRTAFRTVSQRGYVQKVTIELDRDLYTEVKVLAAREGITVREIVTSSLEHYLHTHQ